MLWGTREERVETGACDEKSLRKKNPNKIKRWIYTSYPVFKVAGKISLGKILTKRLVKH